jgi:large repetitive protein
MTVASQVQSAHLLPSGKVLVASEPDITMELYNPATGTWSPNCPSIYPARRSFAVTLLPTGDILLTGGSQRIFAMGDSYVCDPDTRSWTRIDQMPQARRHHIAIVLHSGQVLVSGGGYDMPQESAHLLSPVP